METTPFSKTEFGDIDILRTRWYLDVAVHEGRFLVMTLPDGLQQLSVPDRIALAQALWNSIADQPRPALSDANLAELERRVAEDDAHPEDIVPWEKVKADILARLGRS